MVWRINLVFEYLWIPDQTFGFDHNSLCQKSFLILQNKVFIISDEFKFCFGGVKNHELFNCIKFCAFVGFSDDITVFGVFRIRN